MEKHCSTISFGLKNRKDKNGKSPIVMLIGAYGERAEFQTGKKIEVENWDNGKQQAKGKSTEAKLLNTHGGRQVADDGLGGCLATGFLGHHHW